MSETAAWVAAIASFLSVLVSVISLITSRNAMRATQSVSDLDKTIKLAISDFREQLIKERLLVNNEVIEFRFRGEDDKIKSLEQRQTRTAQDVSSIFAVLLKLGPADLDRIRREQEEH